VDRLDTDVRPRSGRVLRKQFEAELQAVRDDALEHSNSNAHRSHRLAARLLEHRVKDMVCQA
jgi:hypothetical protein